MHVFDIGSLARGLAEIIEYSANFIKFGGVSTPTTFNYYSIDYGPKVSDYTEARVKIQLSQELTLEREAFEASTELTNKLDSDLREISVSLNIENEAGTISNNKFFIQTPTLSNINSISGNGIINSLSASSIKWIIIPTIDSGGTTESGQKYTVQLNISGTVNGVPFTANSEKVKITVKPLPKLNLTYYLPQEIAADQPFHLAVKVNNSGYGWARNLKIQSAQPEIIQNNAGLLLNFRISSSLLADFGDIAPGEEKIKYWTLESSVPGKFSNFSANFTHSSALGGEMTSLVQAVNTEILGRELSIKGMEIPYLKDSNKDNKFDTIFDIASNRQLTLEDAQILSINPDKANLTQKALINKPAGQWVSIEIPDIFNGERTLKMIHRSDGVIVNPMNYWIADNKIIIIDDPDTDYTIKYDYSADNYPPVITNISAVSGINSAVITWDTDEASDSLVKYRTSSGSYPFNVNSNEIVMQHSLALTDLAPDAVYYYAVNSTDAQGNSNESAELTFRTLASAVDTTPPANVTDLHNTTYAQTYINWTWLNPPDPDFSHVMLYLNGTFLTSVQAPQNYYNITGLTPDTTYELGTQTVDTSGNINQTWVNNTARTAPSQPSNKPAIISFTPSSPAINAMRESRTFSVTANQTVNVAWYINGTLVQTNTSVTHAAYINKSARRGSWKVTANASNINGSAIQEWDWNVLIVKPMLFVSASPMMVKVNRSVNMTFKVTSMLKPVDSATVTLTGAGVNAIAATNSTGYAVINVNATSRGQIRVSASKDGYNGAAGIVLVMQLP